MNSAVDSSVLVASLRTSERHHAACAALVDRGGHCAYVHALAETFSSLTGGRILPRIRPGQAADLIEGSILPFVAAISLTPREYAAATREAGSRGVQGGVINDFLHLVAARKAGAVCFHTLDVSYFLAFHRPGDPEIVRP